MRFSLKVSTKTLVVIMNLLKKYWTGLCQAKRRNVLSDCYQCRQNREQSIYSGYSTWDCAKL